jgi:hypothetical protein
MTTAFRIPRMAVPTRRVKLWISRIDAPLFLKRKSGDGWLWNADNPLRLFDLVARRRRRQPLRRLDENFDDGILEQIEVKRELLNGFSSRWALERGCARSRGHATVRIRVTMCTRAQTARWIGRAIQTLKGESQSQRKMPDGLVQWKSELMQVHILAPSRPRIMREVSASTTANVQNDGAKRGTGRSSVVSLGRNKRSWYARRLFRVLVRKQRHVVFRRTKIIRDFACCRTRLAGNCVTQEEEAGNDLLPLFWNSTRVSIV